jgi:hypothetical protein
MTGYLYIPIFIDVSNIIDNLLLEWGMKSDDGLASGPFTEDNLMLLSKILRARGVPIDQLNETISAIIENHWQETDEAIARAKKEPEKADPGDVYSQLRVDKGLSKTFVDSIEKVIENKYPFYKKKFSSVEVETSTQMPAAIVEYNNPENASVNREINQITGTSLGRGELILVWLIKNCKSGGAGKGDIILKNGQKIDVKSYDRKDNSFRIEQNSIDNFQGLPFFVALMDLVSEIRSDPAVKDVLISILDKNVEGEEPIHPATSAKTANFFETLNLDAVSRSTFNGLILLGKRLRNMEVNDESDVLSVSTKGNKLSAALTNPDEVIPNISQLKEPKTLEMDVAPIYDPMGKVILPRLKRLKFFSEEFTIKRITEEIVGALHYNGIVFVNNTGENAQYVDEVDFEKHIQFNRFSKGVQLIFIP